MMIENWDEIENLNESLLRSIYSYGFEKPSPIQQKAITPILQGKDLIAQAQSGTGKTGAFSIGSLNKVDLESQTNQILIISPTRELSLQSFNVLNQLGSNLTNLKMKLLVGGTSVEKDIRDLRENPQIIVGCPGRILDMLYKNSLTKETFKMVIIDEADEMLSFGFKDQIYEILKQFPENIQICLFSATLPVEIKTLLDQFMKDPTEILIKSEMLTLEGISQYYIALENDEFKYDAIKDLYNNLSVSQCIIYCNSIKRVEYLYESMIKDDFAVGCIHGNMEKNERTNIYYDFKKGKIRVLLSTNITARGIDVQQVNTVINYDIPKSVHTYLHRIGRSGRWGRKGVGINFVTKNDIYHMKNIEKFYQTQIKELPLNLQSIYA